MKALAVLPLLLAAGIAVADPRPGPPAPSAREIGLDDREAPLAGSLANLPAWRSYKARFVTEAGRVVDTANGMISHSEGQGYGMLLAVAANDRATFDRLWGWTRANLMVRNDQLIAWRWEPDKRPAVSDLNNATDGDLLVAWALAEASEAWSDVALKVAGRRIAVEVGRKLILPKTPYGPVLLPGVAGFAAEDRSDGPVVNPSYWLFPAFARLHLVAPEFDWAGLGRSGLAILERARFGEARLPTEWVSLAGAEPRPAEGFPPHFGYNAIRVPLYLAWAGVGRREHYGPFLAHLARGDGKGVALVDTASGRMTDRLDESGYAALGHLLACAADGAKLPASFGAPSAQENYYPATLHLLAIAASRMRYGSCART